MIEKCDFIVSDKDSLTSIFAHQGYYIEQNLNCLTFAVKLKEEIIGCALLIKSASERYRLVNIYILPIFRSMGIGSKLLRFISKTLNVTNTENKLCISYDSDYEVSRVSAFYRKNGYPDPIIEYSTYFFPRSKWDESFYPTFNYINYQENVNPKKIGELDKKDLEIISQFIKNNPIPDFLSPFRYHSENQKKISQYYFDIDGNILGWNLVSINNKNQLFVHCTYVVDSYRNFSFVLYFWSLVYKNLLENEKWSSIRSIAFQFDRNNYKLYNFFQRIFYKYVEKEVNSFLIIV